MPADNVLRFADRPSASLKALFPEALDELTSLYGGDRGFREICDDFDRVERRLAELERRGPDPLQHEYATLRRELIAEIADGLRQAPLASPCLPPE